MQKKKVLRARKNRQLISDDLISLLPEYHHFIYRNLDLIERKLQLYLVKVSKIFLEDLNVNSFPYRPEHRRSKAEIDISLTDILLLPNLLTESFSCEIKVKLSFYCISLYFSRNGLVLNTLME